ncbi:MAG: response regulator [Nitrospiraceae bacterium]|nr:response regulator [Nitrospiraceae bacterium]
MAKILIIDDEEMVSELLTIFLSRLGHNAVSAISYSEAEEIYRKEKFDAVFCDYKMPECSGMDAYINLKSLSPGNRLRFALVTGTVVDQSLMKFMKNENIAYLMKPFTGDDIKRLVELLSL